MQRWLCILMLVFPIAIANGPAAAQTQFDLAEQHLIDCATHADLHPPYGGTNTVWEVCHNEMEGYERTCMARVGRMPHTKDECRGAAYSLAMALQKRDPIDVQFVNCLRSKGPANAYPVELLSFCRAERLAFESSCQKRKDTSQCQQDAEELARAQCVLRGSSDYECHAGGK